MNAHQIDTLGSHMTPPELFPIIASFLPLRSAPSTLYALALCNKRLAIIVRPLIYSRLVLRNERDALIMLHRIRDDFRLGRFVKEVHILSDLGPLPDRVREGQDVLTALSQVIEMGCLNVLEALGLYFLTGWRDVEGYNNVMDVGHVSATFWESLGGRCPRLGSLFLRGLSTLTLDRRFHGTSRIADGINFLYLTTLNIDFLLAAPTAQEVSRKILAQLPLLAPTLYSLTLGFSTMTTFNPSPIFALDFPRLRSLILKGFSPVGAIGADSFWQRHVMLERLFLIRYEGIWFSSEFLNAIQRRLLPNLRYFKATFADVRALDFILPNLRSLSITLTINGQLPYLLRRVLRNGLPNLKSLEFVHLSTPDNAFALQEGAMFSETVLGVRDDDMSEEASSVRQTLVTFMLSVARGAPNIEELGFRSNAWGSTGLEILRSQLVEFTHLKRIYCPGCFSRPNRNARAEDSTIIERIRTLAQVCRQLESVTDIDSVDLPYPRARIFREPSPAQIKSIELGFGMGMEGLECERSNPFPQNAPMS